MCALQACQRICEVSGDFLNNIKNIIFSAKFVNGSQLPLLPGPLSVFFNNSFVSTSQLRLVMPGEEFRCLLGVDPALKVEYKRANLSNEQVDILLMEPTMVFLI